MLLAVLDQLAEEKGQRMTLILRPHPREAEGCFSIVRGRAVRTIVSKKGESRDLALAADLVVGMNSMLLVEACCLGCITVSLQPGLRFSDTLPTNRSGLSRAVYRQEELKPVLEEMIFDKQARMASFKRLSSVGLDSGSTRRVVGMIYRITGME